MIFNGISDELLDDMVYTFGIVEAYAIVQGETKDMNELVPFDTFCVIAHETKKRLGRG